MGYLEKLFSIIEEYEEKNALNKNIKKHKKK